MAKRCFLIVKKREWTFVWLRVDAECFGRGTDRTIRRIMLHEFIEEHLVNYVDPYWFGGHVYTILPRRRFTELKTFLNVIDDSAAVFHGSARRHTSELPSLQ